MADDEDAFRLAIAESLDDAYVDMFEVGGTAARRALGVRGAFRLESPAVAEALAQRANLLAGNVADDVFERLKTVLAEEFYFAGKGPLDVARTLRGEFDWLTKARSELIARTETGAIVSEASWITYSASGVPFKRWLCVAPDTRVSGAGITHIARRLHTGKMVKLLAASGNVVTVTGNHRVLTRRGWIAADAVHEGDDLVRYESDMESSAPATGEVPDVDHMPPPIAEVFDTLYQSASAMGMVTRIMDLDCEGRYSEIEVISLDGQLLGDVELSCAERFGEWIFKLSDMRLLQLLSERAAAHADVGNLFAGVRSNERSDAVRFGGSGFSASAEKSGGRLGSQRLAYAEDCLRDNDLGSVPSSRELFERSSVSVLFGYDRCVRVDVQSGSGHVYDYTTATGWMVANGLVVHNSTLDGKEREDHFDAHGQIRAIDEPYDVGGEQLMHPLDPAGSAAQVCNCRCDEVPIVTADQAFSDADVWDGTNNPDQFARERLADPDRPPRQTGPDPSATDDLNFAFPEDE
jgi:hypothetical protein